MEDDIRQSQHQMAYRLRSHGLFSQDLVKGVVRAEHHIFQILEMYQALNLSQASCILS